LKISVVRKNYDVIKLKEIMLVLGNMFCMLFIYHIMFLSTLQKHEKYKDTRPTAIDLFKEIHCGKTKGFNEPVKKTIVSTRFIPLLFLLLLGTLCNEPLFA
jgi:hypothetical protein